MSEGAVNNTSGETDQENSTNSRRYFLIQATSAVAAVGAVGAAWPFIKYWTPSAKARAAGAPVKIDFSKLSPGEMLSPIVAWRGKPIFVVYRDQPSIDSLETDSGGLADPDSTNPEQQPDFAVNPWRSERPEIGVYVGICTHLGCAPTYRPDKDGVEQNWPGGFFCSCHGSKFDFAGRAFKGVPAPINLEVPPHTFTGPDTLVIGRSPTAEERGRIASEFNVKEWMA